MDIGHPQWEYIYILKYWKSQFTNLNQICKHDIIKCLIFKMFIYGCLFEVIIYSILIQILYMLISYIHDIFIFIQTYMHLYLDIYT